MSTIEFPAGKFYDCQESEILNHRSPEEAIEFLFDEYDPGEIVDAIRKRGPVTLTAYEPMGRPENWFRRQAERIVDDVIERHDDDFAACSDDPPQPARQPWDLAIEEIEAALLRLFADVPVWNCQEVGKMTLTPEQVEGLMREYRPDWFEETSPERAEAGETSTSPAAPEGEALIPFAAGTPCPNCRAAAGQPHAWGCPLKAESEAR